MKSGQVQCDFCRAKFPVSEFSGGGAVVLLGKNVCGLCVEKKTQYCHFCRAGIHEQDFAEGRAVTLLGKRYCEKCLAAAVERSRPSSTHGSSVGRPIDVQATPSPASRSAPAGSASQAPAGAELRAFERFVPPREARLFIRPSGLEGILGKNRVRMWLDLSEGGVRAIVQGACEKGDELQGEIRYDPLKARHPVTLKIRHVHPSKSFPDCSVVGLKFVDPDSELRSLVRNHLRIHPLMGSMEGEPEAPKAPASPPSSPSLPRPGAPPPQSRAG